MDLSRAVPVASTTNNSLKISAVVDNNYISDLKVKDKVPVWGSVATWYHWKTDNVVSNRYSEAVGLLKRNFQQQCNLYIPQQLFADLQRPAGVRLFNGTDLDDIDQAEQIIAMHLIGNNNDIVLLLGFDLSDQNIADKYQNHLRKKYLNQFVVAVNAYPETQWVCVDHGPKIPKHLRELANLTFDSAKNIQGILG